MIKLNFFYPAALSLICLFLTLNTQAQEQSGYYASNIQKAIKAKKTHLKIAPAKLNKLNPLNQKQLSGINVKGAIGATAAGKEAALSKQDKLKLELLDDEPSAVSSVKLKLDAKNQVFLQPIQNALPSPTVLQGSYSGKGYKSSFYNIQGSSTINARTFD